MDTAIRVRVVREWADVETLRTFWGDQVQHPNAGYDLFVKVLRARKEVLRPHLVVLERHDTPVCMVVCRLEDMSCQIGLGYLRLFRMRVRTLVVMHGGVLGAVDQEGADAVVATLMAALKEGEATRVLFSHIPDESLLAASALRSSSRWQRGGVLEKASHWSIEVPQTRGEFLARMKAKHRSYLKKMQRDLDARFPDGVRYVCYRRPEEMPAALEDIERIASKTYQRGLGVGVRGNAEYLTRYTEAAAAGRLRIWLLYGGSVPLAYRVGQVYGSTIHAAGIGYDPDFAGFRPGNLLLVHAMDELSEGGVLRYDLGLGDAAYKQRFGTFCTQDLTFSVYAGRLPAQCAKLLIGASHHASSLLKAMVDRLHATDTVKRFFRAHAARNASSGDS